MSLINASVFFSVGFRKAFVLITRTAWQDIWNRAGRFSTTRSAVGRVQLHPFELGGLSRLGKTEVLLEESVSALWIIVTSDTDVGPL